MLISLPIGGGTVGNVVSVHMEGGNEMTTQTPSQTRQVIRSSRGPGPLVALIAIILVVGAAVVVWIATSGQGPVAASDAQLEMTLTDEGSAFVGDHEIVEGTATITFTNETAGPVTFMAFGYETGSVALAEELGFLEEGDYGVPIGVDPAEGFFDPDIGGEFEPGEHTLTADLQPGTYIFDASTGDVMTAGLWRVAVIEVVSE